MVKGMGGAMDLVASTENIIVAMMACQQKGRVKNSEKMYPAINWSGLRKT
jgi:acyl CoA:acetate/3-ketoacid CoA transferase beta subunit